MPDVQAAGQAADVGAHDARTPGFAKGEVAVDPKNVVRVLGKLGSERGRANERHVLEACLLPARPSWMTSARAATRAEDHDGIDVVVESDVGNLYVQVKSSRTGKAAFVERRRRAHVAVVVVKSGDTLEEVLRRVVGALGPVRKQYLAERGGVRQ